MSGNKFRRQRWCKRRLGHEQQSLVSRLRWIVFILVPVIFCISGPRLSAQRADTDLLSSKNALRWRYFLDQLSLEARTLSDENTRAEALAVVADAYWELAPNDSKKLFFAALDLALSTESIGKSRDSAVHQVITAAARRDNQLARDLIEKVLTKKDKQSNKQLIKTSLDLLKVDKTAAEMVALSSISAGLSLDVAWFIFELHKLDSAAADRVYLAYLNHPNSRSLHQLIWLAGYPFGYVEAFGGASNPTQFVGVFGLRSPALSVNRVFANRFLEAAHQSIAATVESASQASAEKREGLHSLVFFTLKYLRPEAERYRPDLRAWWDEMEQLAAAGINPIRRQEVLDKANSIFSARPRSGTQTPEQNSVSDTTQTLERAERMAAGCERDTTYAQVALKSAYEKDFQKAVVIADKISDLKIRSNLIQFVYFDKALAAMSSDTLTNIDEAVQHADRITSYEHRTLLYVMLAKISLTRNNRERAYELLLNASKLAQHVEESAPRAGLLITIANQISEIDTIEPIRVLKEAIRAVNKIGEPRIDQLSVLRKVDLSCDDKNPLWYGTTESIANSDLIETLVKLSRQDEETAIQLARDLIPAANRVRVLAAIAGAAVKRVKMPERRASDRPSKSG